MSGCPIKKKYNEKGHHKRSSKSIKTYVAWKSDNDSSIYESSTSNEESAWVLLMKNGKKKKKVVSHSKIDNTHDLSYSQL